MKVMPASAAAANHEQLPLTAAQTAIASAQQSLGDCAEYWTAQCLKLSGSRWRAVHHHLEACLTELLSACETLHLQPQLTALGWHQRVCAPSVRLNQLALATPEQALTFCQTQCEQAFTLGETLFQCHLIELPEAVWVYLQVHHLAFDGYSYSLFWQALCARLANLQLPLPDWSVTHLIQQDRALRASPSHQEQVRVMSARLPAPLPWQGACPLAGISKPRLISETPIALAEVQAVSAKLNLSWPQWLACACGWTLHQLGWTHQRALGLVNMARRGPQARVPLNCMGLQVLHSPAADTLEAYINLFLEELNAWHACPHLRWEELAPAGFSHPLGACVNLLLFPQNLKVEGCDLQLHTLAQGPVAHLNVNVRIDSLNVYLEAAIPSQWQPQASQAVLQALKRLLVNPAEDLTQPPVGRLAGPTATAPIDLLGRLWQQKSRTPNAPAYRSLAGVTTSYQSLYRQMVYLSERLEAQGVHSGERVALWAQPGLASLLAFLAIGFCQASYVPLDTNSSPERLQAQLAAAGVKWLLAPTADLPALHCTLACMPHLALINLDTLLSPPASGPAEHRTPCTAPPAWAPEREAYVLFTSGSSGEPKGVVMLWGAYGHFLAAAQRAYQPPLAARWLMFATMSFDASLEEIGLCLSHGGCLFERPDPCDFERLTAFIKQQQINVLDLPTAYWHQWIATAPPPAPSLKLTIIGGEALCPARLAAFQQLPGLGRLINSYGPTEACIVACAQEMAPCRPATPPDRSPLTPREDNPTHPQPILASQTAGLGYLLAGMGALVMDPQGQPLPQGSIGELYLFGPQLAAGYLAAAQTRQRFVRPAPAWLIPGPLYATGDLVRLNAAGVLEFLGRSDDEIKLDGQRIDIQQLTQAHLAEPTIAQAALWLERRAGPSRILAALILAPGAQFDGAALKTRLAAHWPRAALPSRYIVLDQLPLNSRGKTDWAALADRAQAQHTPPATDLRQRVQQLWQDCLGAPPGANEDFWQAGGRSLTALVLAQNISRLIGSAFPAQRLYANPRFSDLLQIVEQLAADGERNSGSSNLRLYRPAATRTPVNLYACAPIDGGVEVYRPLGPACALPLWGLPSADLVHQAQVAQPFDDWVSRQCQWLLKRPGEAVLLGWSSGGSLALALASALSKAGRPPRGVLLLDAYPPQCWQAHPEPTRREALLNLIDVPAGFDPSTLNEEELTCWLARPEGSYPGLTAEALNPLILATLNQMRHFRRWRFAPYTGPVHYLAATQTPGPVRHEDALTGAACGPIHWHSLNATHLGLLDAAHIPALAAVISAIAQQVNYVDAS